MLGDDRSDAWRAANNGNTVDPAIFIAPRVDDVDILENDGVAGAVFQIN